jgi:1,4-dihydroxy-2-naphthoate octaprenyltransferase
VKNIFRHFVYANGWVALAAAMQTLESYYLSGSEPSLSYLFFVLFSTLCIYSFHRLRKTDLPFSEDVNDRHSWLLKNPGISNALFILSGIIALALSFFQDYGTHFIFWPCALLAIAYSSGPARIREIPGMKIFVLSAVWVAITVVIPLFQNDLLHPENSLRILTRFFFIFSLCIAFDIRDLQTDPARMKTIPQVIGKNGAILMGIFLLIVTSVLYWFFLERPQAIALSITAIIAMIILYGTRKQREDLYYGGLTESLMIIQVFAVMISYLF